jgi:serine/threonine protein kinase
VPEDAFGPFRLLHQIGAGGLVPVFRAYDSERGRLVTVKRFRLDLPPERIHQLVAAFERLVAAEWTHPVLAAPLATGIVEADAFLVQEFCAGESLDTLPRRSPSRFRM